MVESAKSRKRKAITKDVAPEPIDTPGDEFLNGDLDGILSGSEDESHQSGSESDAEEGLEEDQDDEEEDEDEDEEDLFSDEASEDEDIREQIRALRTTDEPATEAAAEKDDDFHPLSRVEELETNYIVTKDANGNPRYVYKEIDPVYDSDDSDNQDNVNTIGDIPLSYYDAYPHIGYDINGKKIMRPAKGQALDALLDSIELPKGWTGLTDPATGKPLNLSQEELEVLKKVSRNEHLEDGYDPYPEMVEYFSSKTEIMPLSAAPEPKRRFIPSKNENKRIMKIVKAIREGRIKPYRAPEDQVEEDTTIQRYDIWADETPRPDNSMHIPAPKLPPPGYEDSYHPPPEYLPDDQEKADWEAQDPEDRKQEYLPTDHGALRKVPGYDNVKMVFERCLDLYLAPRVRRNRLNIDPESLLPKLPSPDELRPFPTTCATLFRGHEGKVRSVSVDATGTLLASGGDDGTVRIWDILTGRNVWTKKLSSEEAVDVVRWRPSTDTCILSAAAGETIFFIIPQGVHTVNPEIEIASRAILDAGFGYEAQRAASNSEPRKEPAATWSRPLSKLVDNGIMLTITVRAPVKVISWHRRGDYFATVSPKGQSHAVAIHTLSKHLTQLPFRKLKGLPQTAQFHPSKPIFFVATQRSVRSYDLAKQELVKILKPGARWISSIDIHAGGDNVIIGSYDRRLLWHDLDLSVRPYKTLRYHDKAIRAVKYHHGGFPLFADASDDGTVQIFHGKVVDDLMENATIVPLKVLKGHAVKGALGVLDLDWHPKHPCSLSENSSVHKHYAPPFRLLSTTSPIYDRGQSLRHGTTERDLNSTHNTMSSSDSKRKATESVESSDTSKKQCNSERLSEYGNLPFDGKVVSILVGENEKIFTLHVNRICLTSDFFKRMLHDRPFGFRENVTNEIKLPEQRPEVFELFARFVYYGHVGPIPAKNFESDEARKTILSANSTLLLKAVALADYLQCDDFHNAIMDNLVLQCVTHRSYPVAGSGIKLALSSGSPLLVRFLQDACISVGNASWWDYDNKVFEHTDFWVSVMKGMAALLGGEGRPKKWEPKNCDYHRHKDGKRCDSVEVSTAD
ncbi:BOP1NT-domain-containing protein [Microthyrium microscopicum]|uniref:Ribosome biogenesis protein ERB1 n=1 Tax=Microthyrium microscopicum TaxID=703497 RepID=A0A6A6UA34_9PEZI|nr:BOP1NT-domain-containing protein [Microthyrium microscopicum]